MTSLLPRNPACSECGRPASGNFCQHCGADLGGRFCSQCGAKISFGSNFCGQCGAQLSQRGEETAGQGRSPRLEAAREVVIGGQTLPWWIAGVTMFALILFVGLSMVRPGPGPVPSTSGPIQQGLPAEGLATGGAAPDISNMSPIEAADRLFNRVMQATSAGDSAQARAFLPMAIAAYQRARPLTLDGLFHLSMLNRTAMNLEAALDNALEILERDPDHLLGLAAAAEAAIELGELDEAELHYRHLADVYEEELQEQLPEYDQHSLIVDVLNQDAERFLAGR